MKLEDLITQLEKRIKAKAKNNGDDKIIFANIANPNALIANLKELKDMIGNRELKDSIASQIGYLMTTDNNSRVMLNTILYGPPGVGKTKIGVLLAKIWHSMGYLKRNVKKQQATTMETLNNMSSQDLLIGLTMLLLLWSLFGGIIVTVYKKIGPAYFILLTGVVIIIIIYYYQYYNTNGSDINSGLSGNSNNILGPNITEDLPVTEEQLIKIVSREDFVDLYVGWTDKKTIALLERNLGKVLFIDEAYSLYHGPQDTFGMEALTTLNRFLSERPGEIIVIFGGYEKQMKEGIFNAQPGLPRRCIWHFKCEPYNSQELFDIFQQQLAKKGYRIQNRETSRQLFQENYDKFPNYAGDTEKLVFYCQMAYSDELLSGHPILKNNISYDQLRIALDKLVRNNLKSDNSHVQNRDLSGLMKLLQQNN